MSWKEAAVSNMEVLSLAFSRDWWKPRNTSWEPVLRKDWNRHLSHKSTRRMAFTGADSLQRPSFFRLRHLKEACNTLRATFGRGCRPSVQQCHAWRGGILSWRYGWFHRYTVQLYQNLMSAPASGGDGFQVPGQSDPPVYLSTTTAVISLKANPIASSTRDACLTVLLH